MKKTTLTLLLSVATVAMAQIPKGSIWGSLNFALYSSQSENKSVNGNTTTDNDKYSYRNFNIGPGIQYFVKENVSISAGVNLNSNKNSSEDVNAKTKSASESQGVGGSIGINKYFTLTETFLTYIGLSMALAPSKGSRDVTNSQNVTTTTKTEYKSFNTGVNAGFAWLASQRVMFFAAFAVLSFESWKNKYDISGSNYTSTSGRYMNFLLNTGYLYYSIGFAYRLTK